MFKIAKYWANIKLNNTARVMPALIPLANPAWATYISLPMPRNPKSLAALNLLDCQIVKGRVRFSKSGAIKSAEKYPDNGPVFMCDSCRNIKRYNKLPLTLCKFGRWNRRTCRGRLYEAEYSLRIWDRLRLKKSKRKVPAMSAVAHPWSGSGASRN